MAVHARHIDVTDHQAERLAPHRQQRFFRRTDGSVVVPGQHQRIGQRLTQGPVILNQQHLDRHYFHSTPGALENSGKHTVAQVPRPSRERSCNSP
ncbi:hypothetical protein D3C78_1605880 [compost metagenome]